MAFWKLEQLGQKPQQAGVSFAFFRSCGERNFQGATHKPRNLQPLYVGNHLHPQPAPLLRFASQAIWQPATLSPQGWRISHERGSPPFGRNG